MKQKKIIKKLKDIYNYKTQINFFNYGGKFMKNSNGETAFIGYKDFLTLKNEILILFKKMKYEN